MRHLMGFLGAESEAEKNFDLCMFDREDERKHTINGMKWLAGWNVSAETCLQLKPPRFQRHFSFLAFFNGWGGHIFWWPLSVTSVSQFHPRWMQMYRGLLRDRFSLGPLYSLVVEEELVNHHLKWEKELDRRVAESRDWGEGCGVGGRSSTKMEGQMSRLSRWWHWTKSHWLVWHHILSLCISSDLSTPPFYGATS